MNEILDGWLEVTESGEIVGSGTGYCVPQPGNVLIPKPVVADDLDYSHHRAWDRSRDTLLTLALRDRNFLAKYDCAVSYLALVPGGSTKAEQEALLDEVNHVEMYDEYWNTYNLVPWTPVELAEAIISRHVEDNNAQRLARSLAEAELRREKLMAEEVALTPPVVE